MSIPDFARRKRLWDTFHRLTPLHGNETLEMIVNDETEKLSRELNRIKKWLLRGEAQFNGQFGTDQGPANSALLAGYLAGCIAGALSGKEVPDESGRQGPQSDLPKQG